VLKSRVCVNPAPVSALFNAEKLWFTLPFALPLSILSLLSYRSIMDSNPKNLNLLPPLELLVDDENECLQPAFVNTLGHIFSKYCTPAAAVVAQGALMKPPENAYLSGTGIDQFAIDTNGEPLDADAKAELRDMLDVNAQGDLTFHGFLQMYELQTLNDMGETWNDLVKHGFDFSLQLKVDEMSK